MPDHFKDAMRLLAGAVTIVTAGRGDKVAGLTATAVCSLSVEPPRMLVCLNRFGATFAALAESNRFCVNVLSADQQHLAGEFAGRTGKEAAEKFAPGTWDLSESGSPRNLAALTAVRCSVHSITILATHAVVIGDVMETYLGPQGGSLIYREQSFLEAG